MADDKKDDSADRIHVLPDVVPGTALAVSSRAEAMALARRMAGDAIPNEMRFRCITCGWDKTLQFDDDEILALNNDISQYGGPCGDCGSMTLVPFGSLFGADFKPILERDKEQRHKEYKEQAVVQAQTLVEEVKRHIVGGSTLDGGMVEPDMPPVAPAAPAAASDDEMSTEGLTPRKG